MAMDWNNQDEINKRRQAAIQAGFDPKVIDQFITEKKTEAASINLMQQGVMDVSKVAQDNPLLAQQAIKLGVQPKQSLTAEEEKQKMKLDNVSKAVELLKKNLGEAEATGPLLGRIAGFLSGATSGGIAPEIADYEALRKSLIGPLARAISGEVGQLTDKDIARAEGLLPKISDSTKLRQNKLKNLEDMIREKKQSINKNNDPLGLGL